MFRWPALLALLLLAALPPRAEAHPHVRIDAEVTAHLTDGKITRLSLTWWFDEFVSSDMMEVPPGAKRAVPPSAERLKKLAADSEQGLKFENYYTLLVIGERRQPVQKIENLTASFEKRRLVYRFDIPLPEPVDPIKQPLGVLLYDETFYVDISVPDDQKVAYKGLGPKLRCGESRATDRAAQTAMGGFAAPILITLKCQ